MEKRHPPVVCNHNAMLARFNAKDFDGGLRVGLDALGQPG